MFFCWILSCGLEFSRLGIPWKNNYRHEKLDKLSLIKTGQKHEICCSFYDGNYKGMRCQRINDSYLSYTFFIDRFFRILKKVLLKAYIDGMAIYKNLSIFYLPLFLKLNCDNSCGDLSMRFSTKDFLRFLWRLLFIFWYFFLDKSTISSPETKPMMEDCSFQSLAVLL